MRSPRHEYDKVGEVDTLMAAQITQPPGAEQQPADHQEVDRHGPFDGGNFAVERGADHRQSRVTTEPSSADVKVSTPTASSTHHLCA